MGQDEAEACLSDAAFADVPVPVSTRAKGSRGVIGVDDSDPIKAEEPVQFAQDRLQALFRGDVMARLVGMGGIQAKANALRGAAGFGNGSQFLEVAAQKGASTGGVL